MRRYHNLISYDLDENTAYSIGLIASDGNLSKDKRHITLVSNDIEQLENFSKAIGKKLNIKSYKSSVDRSSFRIQFSDVAYYDFLFNLGIEPAKSKTISSIDIPDRLFYSYLRGIFDGDGTVYGYTDKRWKNSRMFYFSITSASYEFIDIIRHKIHNLSGTNLVKIKVGARVYSIVYAKNDSYLIYKEIYKNHNNLYLSRKKIKFDKFLLENKLDIIE